MSLKAFAATAVLIFVAACGGDGEPDSQTVGERAAQASETSASTPPAAAEPSVEATSSSSAETDAGEAGSDAAEVGQPARLIIPAIDVDADLVELGLNDDGSMETPDYASNLAGWYIEGPKPGARGPAVIVAHVDNADGPDTFARLHELDTGDEIVVTDDLGNEYTWTVQRSQVSNRQDLPADEIWNDTDEPVLRLITCTGAYVDGSYVENLIIYAA